MQKTSNNEKNIAKSFNSTIKNKDSSEQVISASTEKSVSRFSRSQLAIFGAIAIAIIATFILVPKGSNFCFFSSCDRTLPDPSLAHNFWSLAGGFGMGAIIIPFVCGAVPLPFKPDLMAELVSLSPFYHYKALVFEVAQLNHDGELFLHLLWLFWAFGAFGLSTIWIYQRDRVIQ